MAKAESDEFEERIEALLASFVTTTSGIFGDEGLLTYVPWFKVSLVSLQLLMKLDLPWKSVLTR